MRLILAFGIGGSLIGLLAVLLVRNATVFDPAANTLWRQQLALWLLLLLVLAGSAIVIIRRNVLRPIRALSEWMREVRVNGLTQARALPEGEWAPLTQELAQTARSLINARAAAEQEARLRLNSQSRWTAERLKEHVRAVFQGQSIFVISNREPYSHVRQGRDLRCVTPPSGLVTALEPILRVCGGTWIAQASGNADRETADRHGRVKVPPEEPSYTLKRVWLTEEEEQGYYHGFANEGLWPLCHIAYTRPLFRAEDWKHYQRVNTKFMHALLEEIEGIESPVILVQDYHFALLPRMIKERRPDARVALFWHIPWPNPEAFGICPWARELLHGMLGADVLGFHIQFHCNNLLDTVDRILETRIDWEQFAVHRADHTTFVKPFPISIALPDDAGADEPAAPDPSIKEGVKERLGLRVQWLGVGVDRLDYTKGLRERFQAIERFLEQHAFFRERFTFIQIGAPSRTLIPRYQQLDAEMEEEIERINQRFRTPAWRPIVLLKRHHSHEELLPFYQAADVCLVTSLHDGMNLVAKEFVAARPDHRGALILSHFTGASRELRDALLVNPYDVDQVASALERALNMDAQEQQARMARMRAVLRENNIYRWAANLLTELAKLHQAAPPARVPVDRHDWRHAGALTLAAHDS